jgi:hypothetical protein
VIYPFLQRVNCVVTNKRVFKLLPMIFGVRIKVLSMVNKPMRVVVGRGISGVCWRCLYKKIMVWL